ncbi:MAG: hypothetical protein R3F43_19750 [bacterium]
MIRKIHLSNAASRDATVAFTGLRPAAPPRPGLPGKDIRFVRYLATSEAGRHEALQARFGEDYAQALVDADPEVDVDQVGRRIGRTDTVYLSASGDVLYAPPSVVEILLGPDGAEKERRAPDDREANINDEAIPLRWTGRKLKIAQVVGGFVIHRTVQIRHVDGLSYDYLFAMAKELAGEGAMVMIGGGAKGRDPLIFSTNGSPYRGFLEGRVDGERHQLLLHLSAMELKRPVGASAEEDA